VPPSLRAGKVESLKSREVEVPEIERERAKSEAQRYFHLAYRYAKGTPAPALLIVCGMAGTGKSTVAQMLGDSTGFPVFNSDAARKRLACIPSKERVTENYRSGIYSDDFSRLTYNTLLAEAERSLKAGKGAIVDATFKEPNHRGLFLDLASRLQIPTLFVECRAREDEIFRRLQERGRRLGEVSDVTWEVYLRQREEFATLP